MGWGILVSQREQWSAGSLVTPTDYHDPDCYVAFYCNTGDEAFGPLTTARGSPAYVKQEFYRHWDDACREVVGHPIDPRRFNNPADYSLLYQIIYLTILLGGIEAYQTREEYDEMFPGGEDE
tara:strand:- start:10904 stop:11269 length:366 start_codon:yes stop_codon:yes gene_type:complete